MKTSEAYVIVHNIKDDRFTDEEKGYAIHTVLNMATHNSITKDVMLQIIDWLFNKAFEWR